MLRIYRGTKKNELAWKVAGLRGQLAATEAQRDSLKKQVESLLAQVESQGQMLARAAEGRCETAGRVHELEVALAPFAAVLASGWDRGALPATATYPVRMGDLRRAARVHAGTVVRTEGT